MIDLLNNIFSIFQYDFMIRAFIAGLIIAVLAPLIGQFLVMRRLALISDALAHIALAGATIGYATGISPLISSLIATTTGSTMIEWLRKKDKNLNESVLAMFLFGSLALSSIVATASGGGTGKIISFLFGSIATVSEKDIILILILGVITILFTTLNFKKLFALYYDEDYATAMQYDRRYTGLIFTVVIAIVVSFSIQIVGSLLIGGLMTIPVAISTKFSKSFLETAVISIIFAISAVILGLFVSFFINIPSGGLIILILILMYATSTIVEGVLNKKT